MRSRVRLWSLLHREVSLHEVDHCPFALRRSGCDLLDQASWRVDLSMVGPPDRRKQGPIQFLENNPVQSSFWVRFMCPKTRRNWLRLPIVRFHPGSSCPQAAALRQSHTRGRRPPPFPRDSCVSWHTVNLRGAHLAPMTSEHFHVFSPPPRLSVRMFGSGGKKRANASSNCAAL